MLKTFFAPRYKIIITLLVFIFLLATLGITMGPSLPVIGTPVFMASVMIWYIPGLVFSGTGLFKVWELGAHPTS